MGPQQKHHLPLGMGPRQAKCLKIRTRWHFNRASKIST